MMLGYKKLGGIILGAVALLTLLPAAAQSQFIRYSPIFWSFDGRGGIALPVGDLGDVTESGVTVGAGLAYFLNPRFALRIDGNTSFLGGKDGEMVNAASGTEAPEQRVFDFVGGFEVHLTDPSTSKARFTIGANAGGTVIDGDEFSVADFDGTTNQPAPGFTTTTAFEDTYFTVGGSVRLGVKASRLVDLFVGGDIKFLFLDEDDTAPIAHLYGTSPFDSGLLIPIQGGIRINVP